MYKYVILEKSVRVKLHPRKNLRTGKISIVSEHQRKGRESRKEELQEAINYWNKKWDEKTKKFEKEGASESSRMASYDYYNNIISYLERTLHNQNKKSDHSKILYHGTDSKSALSILSHGIKARIGKGEGGEMSWASSSLKEAQDYAKEVGGNKHAVVVISDFKRAGFSHGGEDPSDYRNWADTPLSHIKEVRFYNGNKMKIVRNKNWKKETGE